jgi:hypothetical protein
MNLGEYTRYSASSPHSRKEKETYIIHAFLVGLKSLFIFSEEGSCCKVFPQRLKITKILNHHWASRSRGLVFFLTTYLHTHFPVPVDTDYSNRFQLCAEGYTLPTSLVSAISPSRDPNAGSLSFLVRPNLNGYPERVRPPPCPNRTKLSPSYSPGAPQPS